jgi:hypothetical protein
MSRSLSLVAAALALAVASAASAQSTVYTHEFDTIGGWPDSDVTGDLTAVYTVVGGEYLINPLENMTYALAAAPATSPSPDMVVEADVRLAASQAQSRAGVACRVGRDKSFYAFNLIASGGYEIAYVRGPSGKVLTSGAIGFDPADGARLKAVCRGTQLSFYANGELLAEVSDDAIGSAGGAGLFSVSPVIAATNAAFDNFALASYGGSAAADAGASRSAPRASFNGGGRGGAGGGSLPSIEDMAVYADDGFGKPGDKRTVFDPGRQRVYLVMDLEYPAPADYRVEWVAIRGTDETKVLDGRYDNPGDDRRVWLYGERNWTPGLYRVDVYANGQYLDQREFSVY